jgi:hypothetical protein
MPEVTQEEELLDTNQAGAFLKRPPTVLAVWRCNRRYPLPYVRIGRRVYYTKSALLKFLNDRVDPGVGEHPVDPRTGIRKAAKQAKRGSRP